MANSSGAISMKALIWLSLIACAVYLGIKFFPPYFDYYMFKGEVEAEAETADMHPDQDVVRHIFQKAEDWGVPLKEENLILERRANEIEISVAYKIDINFFNKYTKTLYFNIHAVKPLKSK